MKAIEVQNLYVRMKATDLLRTFNILDHGDVHGFLGARYNLLDLSLVSNLGLNHNPSMIRSSFTISQNCS